MRLAARLARRAARIVSGPGRAAAQAARRSSNWLWAAWFTLRHVDEWTRFPAVAFERPVRIRIRIRKAPTARLVLRGRLFLRPFIEGREPVGITLWSNARMVVEDDFALGDGTRIAVDEGAVLRFGGGLADGRGITGRAVVMVRRRLEVGRGCLISFDTYLTDCDWHPLDGELGQADTLLGEDVWVGAGAHVLKGARIGAGSVVAARSAVLAGEHPARALLAGIPARPVREGIPAWSFR